MSLPLSRHQILLFRGQMERLTTIYTTRSASEVIRALVEQHLRQVELKLKERQDGNT